jgi:hypothetical protein
MGAPHGGSCFCTTDTTSDNCSGGFEPAQSIPILLSLHPSAAIDHVHGAPFIVMAIGDFFSAARKPFVEGHR